jgi:hypothetical protein
MPLWVDPAVHRAECRRFDSYVMKGSTADDCDFFTGAIGKDGCGRNYVNGRKRSAGYRAVSARPIAVTHIDLNR